MYHINNAATSKNASNGPISAPMGNFAPCVDAIVEVGVAVGALDASTSLDGAKSIRVAVTGTLTVVPPDGYSSQQLTPGE